MTKKLYIKKDNHLLTLLDEEDIQDKLDEKLDIEDASGFLTQQDISGKVDKAQGSNKASQNVVTDSNGNITTEAKPNIPTKTSDLTNNSGFLTSHQDISGKEDKTNKTTSLSSSSTNTQYPSAKAVYDAIQAIPSPEFIEITSNKGTASASTMDKFYVEIANNKRDVYYTEENNGSYSWHKLDIDVLDDLSIDWSDIQNKPSIPSKTSDLTNDSNFLTSHQDISGKVDKAQGSSNASKNVVTDSNGNITTEAKPTIPTKVSQLTNDSGFLTSHQDISGKLDKAQGSTNANKNVVTNASGQIITEAKPTIPTKVSQLTNDSGFLTQHQDISGKANVSDIPTTTNELIYNGLSVTAIPSGGIESETNLNNDVYWDEGRYICHSNNASSLLSSSLPQTSTGFILDVLNHSQGKIQIFTTINTGNPNIYYRIKGSGQPTSWIQIAKVSDIPDISGKVDKVSGKSLVADSEITKLSHVEDYANKTTIVNNLTTGGTTNALSAEQGKWLNNNKSDIGHTHDYLEPTSAITSGSLDNYTQPGIWTCTGDNYLNLTGTKPFTQKAPIIVQNIKYSPSIVVQFVYPVHSSTNINHIYKRIYNGEWGNWISITDDSNIPDISGKENTSNKTSSWNSTTNDTRYPTEKLVKDSLDNKANSDDLATVATTGSYNDLTNKPAPTIISSTVSGTDLNLNSYITPGEYICATTTAAKKLKHTPWGDDPSDNAVAFNMQVYKTGQASGKVMISQIIHDYNGNNTYTRTCFANTASNAYLTTGWSTWEVVVKSTKQTVTVTYVNGTTETINFLTE